MWFLPNNWCPMNWQETIKSNNWHAAEPWFRTSISIEMNFLGQTCLYWMKPGYAGIQRPTERFRILTVARNPPLLVQSSPQERLRLCWALCAVLRGYWCKFCHQTPLQTTKLWTSYWKTLDVYSVTSKWSWENSCLCGTTLGPLVLFHYKMKQLATKSCTRNTGAHDQ